MLQFEIMRYSSPKAQRASFASGSFSEEEFVKQTNEDEANWSDTPFSNDTKRGRQCSTFR